MSTFRGFCDRCRCQKEGRRLDTAEPGIVRPVRQVVDRQHEDQTVSSCCRPAAVAATITAALLDSRDAVVAPTGERVGEVRRDRRLRRRADAVPADAGRPIVEDRIVVVVEAGRDVVRRTGVAAERQLAFRLLQRLRVQSNLIAVPAIAQRRCPFGVERAAGRHDERSVEVVVRARNPVDDSNRRAPRIPPRRCRRCGRRRRSSRSSSRTADRSAPRRRTRSE